MRRRPSESVAARNEAVVIRLRELKADHPFWGYRHCWAHLRNNGFKKDGVDYHEAADLTGLANHMAATIEADIVKQKMAKNNGGYTAINFGKTSSKVYSNLTSEHPIDLVRYQVLNCYNGRARPTIQLMRFYKLISKEVESFVSHQHSYNLIFPKPAQSPNFT